MASKSKDRIVTSAMRKDPRKAYLDLEGNEMYKKMYEETVKQFDGMSKEDMEKEAAEWGVSLDEYKQMRRDSLDQILYAAENHEKAKRKKDEEHRKQGLDPEEVRKAWEKQAKAEKEKQTKKPDPGWAERYLGKKGHSLDSLEEAVWNMSKEDIIRRFPNYGLTSAHSKREMVSIIVDELLTRGYKGDPNFKHKWRSKDM